MSVLGNVPVDECLELMDVRPWQGCSTCFLASRQGPYVNHRPAFPLQLFEELLTDETVDRTLLAASLQGWSLLLARLALREACSKGRK